MVEKLVAAVEYPIVLQSECRDPEIVGGDRGSLHT